MGAKPKIDLSEMHALFRQGRTTTEVAKHFDVTTGAVSQAKRKLNLNLSKHMALEKASHIVTRNLDLVDQLTRINQTAHKIIEDLQNSKALADKQVVLKATAEVRKQLGLQLDILKSLHDFESVEAFQEEVLNTIGEESRDVRERIVQRLKERRALRTAVRIN